MVASLPPWADVFPCLAEIYMASDRTSPANWFRQPNVWRGLLASDANLQPLERDLQLLDPASWALFKGDTAQRTLVDKWGYARALFDCFSELRGYRYLTEQGYEEVRLVRKQQHVERPDLLARVGTSWAAMEVKTVNESGNQKNYFAIPGEQRIALLSEDRISEALKQKLTDVIRKARSQLLALNDPVITRRIVYLVIRFDFHIHLKDDDLATFLQAQTTPDIEILHCLLD